MVGCPLADAAVQSCYVDKDRWLQPHLAVKAFFTSDRWSCMIAQRVSSSLLLPSSWLPAVEKSRGSKSVEVQRVWKLQ